MHEIRKIVGFLMFTTLMLVKVSAFHVYTHNDCDQEAIENCGTCDLVFESQVSNILITVLEDVPSPATVFIGQEELVEAPDSFSILSHSYFFSRPPPATVV